MVDFYDSLDDDNFEDAHSPDSLDCLGSKHPDHRKQLHLSRIKNVHLVNKQYSEPSIILDENSPPECQVIGNKLDSGNKKKGDKSIPLRVFNFKVLKDKGLQLNSDGGFTKSPRTEFDDLPFVTREYRNLKFQKNRTYRTTDARAPPPNPRKKETFGEKPGNGASMISIIRAGKMKTSAEEQFPPVGPSRTLLQNRSPKDCLADDNLTDSMKEVLLQKRNQIKFLPKTFNTSQCLRQVKRVMNLLDNSKLLKETEAKAPVENQKPKVEKCEETPKLPEIAVRRNSNNSVYPIQKKSQARCNPVESNQKKKTSNFNSKIFKHQSEITIKSVKPRLSYWEQQQKKIGFDPLFLRPECKAVATETSRPNFGDSVVDGLSEVSTTVLDREQVLDDEEEEDFYHRVMDYESRGFKMIQSFKNSDDVHKYYSEIRKFPKTQKTIINNNVNVEHRGPSKSTSIEMPPKLFEPVKRPKKSSRKTPLPLTKNELALKAKAYGHMANARNIFKMKTLPEDKNYEPRFVSGVFGSSFQGNKNQKKSDRAELTKEKSYPGRINLWDKESEPFARKSKSLCKTEKYKIDKVADIF